MPTLFVSFRISSGLDSPPPLVNLLTVWFSGDADTAPTVRRRLYDIVKVLEVFGILRKKTVGDEVRKQGERAMLVIYGEE